MTNGESSTPVLFMFSTVTEEAEPNTQTNCEGTASWSSVHSGRLFYYSVNSGVSGETQVRNQCIKEKRAEQCRGCGCCELGFLWTIV